MSQNHDVLVYKRCVHSGIRQRLSEFDVSIKLGGDG